MRVAIVSTIQPYHDMISRRMEIALQELGHDALTFQTSGGNYAIDLNGWYPTHVFSINYPFDKILNSGKAHFTLWLQDIDTVNVMDLYQSSLNLYSISSWSWIRNSKFLPPGTDYHLYQAKHATGYMADIMLSGFVKKEGVEERTDRRLKTARSLLDICKRRNLRLLIAGFGWEMHKEFAPHFVGYLHPGEILAGSYKRSKIVLHDNIWTNMQGRVLEAYACGGFCIPMAMPNDAVDIDPILPGLPKHHDTDLEDVIMHYIDNDDERLAVASSIKAVVHEKHTWKNRMQSWIEML